MLCRGVVYFANIQAKQLISTVGDRKPEACYWGKMESMAEFWSKEPIVA